MDKLDALGSAVQELLDKAKQKHQASTVDGSPATVRQFHAGQTMMAAKVIEVIKRYREEGRGV